MCRESDSSFGLRTATVGGLSGPPLAASDCAVAATDDVSEHPRLETTTAAIPMKNKKLRVMESLQTLGPIRESNGLNLK
jgi:hypothetical protein